MEEEDQKCSSCGVMSSEIVEIGEDRSDKSRDGGVKDVYVAVGRNDSDVVKWAIEHAAGDRVFLVHVFPPITYISTPVGRLSRSQLSQEQARFYVDEENKRRRNLLEKYIRLCTDAKVTVDTLLLESNAKSKAILELIHVLNITSLVMGTKRPPSSSRWLMINGRGKGEFVKKNAPDFCEVTIVFDGKKLVDSQHVAVPPSFIASAGYRDPNGTRQSERNNSYYCICFSGKSNQPMGKKSHKT